MMNSLPLTSEVSHMTGRIIRKTNIAANDARLYDRLFVPWVSNLESIISPPVGVNLVAIATKA